MLSISWTRSIAVLLLSGSCSFDVFRACDLPPQSMTAAAPVSPPPNARKSILELGLTLPSSSASVRAMGIEPADVFPYRSR